MDYLIKKCVGCGHCCITAICTLGQSIYKVNHDADCPALIWNGNRYICKLANEYKKILAIGEGCCQPLCNDWRLNVKERR